MTSSHEDATASRQAQRTRLEAYLAKLPKPAESRGPAEVLADIVLAAALPESLVDDIRNTRPCCLVVKVPGAAWVDPISDAIEGLAEDEDNLLVVRRTQVQKERNLPSLSRRLAAGECVIGVSQIPDAGLPPLLLSMADRRIEIPKFANELVAQAMAIIQQGPVPDTVKSVDVALFDFEELAALLRPDATSTETIERLKAIVRPKLRAGTRKEKLPVLEEAVEYGEAREWGLALRDDLRDLRAGKIEFKDVDKGIVIHGPTGTGKTTYGRMLGEACGIPTIVSSLGELFASGSGYLDSMIKSQRALFEEARSKSPCVLLIDEIDSLPHPGKVSDRNRDYWLPLITDFYIQLDGAMSDRSGVIVIGATNRIESLDPALLRPSRLERAIYLGPPDAAGALRILRHHLNTDLVTEDLTRAAAIAASRHCTGAMIEERVRGARRMARRAGRPMTIEDLLAVIAPAETRSEGDMRRVSIHEAGHAVAIGLLGVGLIRDVSLVMDDEQHGGVEFTGDVTLMTRSNVYDLVRVFLAGRAAEVVLLGEAGTGAGGSVDSDLAQATSLVGSLFLSSGLEDQLVYRATPERVLDVLAIDPLTRNRVDAVLKSLLADVMDRLRLHQGLLERLADTLLQRRFMTGAEVRQLLGDAQVLR